MSFFKEEGNKVIFTGDGELIYYVPEKYFETKGGVIMGEYVEILGVFSYNVFDKNGKARGLKVFNFPTIFKCRPNSITKKTISLDGKSEELPYRLLSFKNGDELVSDKFIPADISNVDLTIDLIMRGNLPNNIPYNKIHDILLNNASLNKFNYKTSVQIMGLVISEIYRSKSDISKQFRLSDMKDMTNYQTITISKVPKYISPYASITSENADEAIANAMIIKSDMNSPLERVMMNQSVN